MTFETFDRRNETWPDEKIQWKRQIERQRQKQIHLEKIFKERSKQWQRQIQIGWQWQRQVHLEKTFNVQSWDLWPFRRWQRHQLYCTMCSTSEHQTKATTHVPSCSIAIFTTYVMIFQSIYGKPCEFCFSAILKVNSFLIFFLQPIEVPDLPTFFSSTYTFLNGDM